MQLQNLVDRVSRSSPAAAILFPENVILRIGPFVLLVGPPRAVGQTEVNDSRPDEVMSYFGVRGSDCRDSLSLAVRRGEENLLQQVIEVRRP
jgi:hypothetical protein